MYEPEPLKKNTQVRKIVRRSRPPNSRIFQGKGNKFVEPEPKETLKPYGFKTERNLNIEARKFLNLKALCLVILQCMCVCVYIYILFIFFKYICLFSNILLTYLYKYMHVVTFQNGHRYYSIFFTHEKRLFGICEFVSLKGMYIRLCNFNAKLPSCGQAQGLVPFLRCWETYCAKQRVIPSFKEDPCNAVFETTFSGHC